MTANPAMVNLLQFDRDALGDWCEQQGEQAFRATQLFRWIHQRGERDFAAMTNLAKAFRDKLIHWVNQPVVTDGHCVTSQGPATAAGAGHECCPPRLCRDGLPANS